MTPFLVGIAGGSGSGKSTFCRQLADKLNGHIEIIQHDNYYVDQSHLAIEQSNRLNFDHPDSLESTLLLTQLQSLRNGQSIEMPTYDFATHSRTTVTQTILPVPIILVDGILLFADNALADVFDLRIFIHTAEDERLRRRIKRDQARRGRTRESVVTQWRSTVQTMFIEFVAPTQNRAHLVVPMDRPNPTAVETVSRALRSRCN
ncbi:UNVERIFIED_CONTAM: hypothetical protein GTU68_004447 [Idotea baltica]|nr:hypothetical protein [Idotea baltica]